MKTLFYSFIKSNFFVNFQRSRHSSGASVTSQRLKRSNSNDAGRESMKESVIKGVKKVPEPAVSASDDLLKGKLYSIVAQDLGLCLV